MLVSLELRMVFLATSSVMSSLNMSSFESSSLMLLKKPLEKKSELHPSRSWESRPGLALHSWEVGLSHALVGPQPSFSMSPGGVLASRIRPVMSPSPSQTLHSSTSLGYCLPSLSLAFTEHLPCATVPTTLLFIYWILVLASPHGLWDFSSPTRDGSPGPWQWDHRVLTTGMAGNSRQPLQLGLTFQIPMREEGKVLCLYLSTPQFPHL